MFFNNKKPAVLIFIFLTYFLLKLPLVAQVMDPKISKKQQVADKLSAKKIQNKQFFSGAKKSKELKSLFNQAEIAYQKGDLETSFRSYEKILLIDPNNIAARLGMELIDRKKEEAATITASEKKYNMINNVDKAWELPFSKSNGFSSNATEQPPVMSQENGIISEKLNKIIIPKIEFFDLPISEAINQIKKKAFLLDTSEIDPNKRGINIVLQFNSLNSINEKRVTLSLADLPLKEVLNYIAKQADLVLRIESYAVVLIPQQSFQEQLITKKYKIPSDIIDSFLVVNKAFGDKQNLPSSFNKEELHPKEFLLSQGVTFPKGSLVYYLPLNNTLIIKNTQSNLDLINSIVTSSFESKTGQVEIETRFLEVKQNNLNEQGLDWLVGSFQFSTGSGITSSDVPNNKKISTSSPASTIINANTVNTALSGTPCPASKEMLALAGILTNPQFQVILRALNQQKGVNLLSAPKVTVSSGRRAVINIAREFPYPADYTPPQIPQNQGSGVNPAVPATPSSFKKRNIGVQLEVEPIIRSDNATIELDLYPQFIEFKGFINYGTPIYSQAPTFFAGQTNAVLSTQQVLLTQNTINQPIFSVRQVTTDVILRDGQTVVLGGLMREDMQKIYNKVPILGSIPLFGTLFRSSSEQKVKQNLIIFVTVHLIK
ncbi:MAG: hypothetical protein K2W99_02375 [Chthoniobacterales bacterium]|nr:hypothetical protein [Chthoniobacterales bacterium]